MVVAPGARDRETEGRFRKDIDGIVREGDLLIIGIGDPKSMRDHSQIGRTNRGLIEAQLFIDSWLLQ